VDVESANDGMATSWNADPYGDRVAMGRQATNGFDPNEYYNYYDNFRDETTRLLEHLQNDIQPGLFDSLGLDVIFNS